MGVDACPVLPQHDAKSPPIHQFVSQVLHDAGLRARTFLAAAQARVLALLHFSPGRSRREQSYAGIWVTP